MKHTLDPVLAVDWIDEGCTVWRACLSCPLPVCLEDMPAGVRSLRGKVRHLLARRLLREGMTVAQIATAFGVSQRAAYKILGSVKAARRRGEACEVSTGRARDTEVSARS